MSTNEPSEPQGRFEDARMLWAVAAALGVGFLGLVYLSLNDPTQHARAPNEKAVTAAKGNPTPAATTAVPTAPAIPAITPPSPSGETQDKNHEE